MLRDIIQIDAKKCTGCGACLTQCAENALAIVDGKAQLVRDIYCDGLGACLGACPEGALTIIQREAAPFDETLLPQAAGASASSEVTTTVGAKGHATQAHTGPAPAEKCAGSAARVLAPQPTAASGPMAAPVTGPLSTLSGSMHSPLSGMAAKGHPAGQGYNAALRTWPVQLRLMPADAPFLRGAHLLLAADCAGFALPDIQALLRDKVLLIACPKLDDAEAHARKLADICRLARPQSITILRMSVPCCGGLERLMEAALRDCCMGIPVRVEQVNLR